MWAAFFVMLSIGCFEVRSIFKQRDPKTAISFFVIWGTGLILLAVLAADPYLPRILEI